MLVLLTIAVIVGCQINPPATTVAHIAFAEESLDDWRTREFAGATQYAITTLDGRTVLQATSDKSASAILREVEVDLATTPYINWRWRVENTYGDSIDEQSKQGDDYPARLYVLVSDGFQPWEVIAVNYVWSSNQPIGTTWVNAWSSKAQMLAVRSGNADIGVWKQEKRNLREDFATLFDRNVDSIKAVAIMVDSDNHGIDATSYFGDIYFTAE